MTPQFAVCAVDGKLVLENGAIRVVNDGHRDGAIVYDLSAFPPREVVHLAMPTSLAGPPQCVAVHPAQLMAVVTAAQRTDPRDPARTVPDNRVTVIDLTTAPPRVSQTLTAGLGPTGVSFSPDGHTVVVANRHDGTLSVFSTASQQLVPTTTLHIGDADCQPASTAFSPDGRLLLVSRDGDHRVSIFEVENGRVGPLVRHISAGIKPYGLCVAPDGRMAVVANVGRGGADSDSISAIDLSQPPYRVVDTLGVPPGPEGVVISPDGRWVVVICHNGTTAPSDAAHHRSQGALVVFAVDGGSLVRHSIHAIGGWAQGAAFSSDGRGLVVQNTVERELQVFRVDAQGFADSGVRLGIPFGSFAAIRTVDFPAS